MFLHSLCVICGKLEFIKEIKIEREEIKNVIMNLILFLATYLPIKQYSHSSRSLLDTTNHKLLTVILFYVPNLCSVCAFTTGCSERQRCGPFSHQRGQESGVRPAHGLVAASTHYLSSAQHLQPHGDVFRLVPPQGQPFYPLSRFLLLR